MIIVFGGLLLINCQTETEMSNLLDFRIVTEEDISFAGTSRMINRVILDVDPLPTGVQMKSVARIIWLKVHIDRSLQLFRVEDYVYSNAGDYEGGKRLLNITLIK